MWARVRPEMEPPIIMALKGGGGDIVLRLKYNFEWKGVGWRVRFVVEVEV